METATPGVKSTRDGWLNRVLSATDCDCSGSGGGRTLADPAAHAADHVAGQAGVGGLQVVPALRGIAMGSALPRALRGAHPALAIEDLAKFGIGGGDGYVGVPEEGDTARRLGQRAGGAHAVIGSAPGFQRCIGQGFPVGDGLAHRVMVACTARCLQIGRVRAKYGRHRRQEDSASCGALRRRA